MKIVKEDRYSANEITSRKCKKKATKKYPVGIILKY